MAILRVDTIVYLIQILQEMLLNCNMALPVTIIGLVPLDCCDKRVLDWWLPSKRNLFLIVGEAGELEIRVHPGSLGPIWKEIPLVHGQLPFHRCFLFGESLS